MWRKGSKTTEGTIPVSLTRKWRENEYLITENVSLYTAMTGSSVSAISRLLRNSGSNNGSINNSGSGNGNMNNGGGLNNHGLQHGMTNISGSGMTLGMTGGTCDTLQLPSKTVQTNKHSFLLIKLINRPSLNVFHLNFNLSHLSSFLSSLLKRSKGKAHNWWHSGRLWAEWWWPEVKRFSRRRWVGRRTVLYPYYSASLSLFRSFSLSLLIICNHKVAILRLGDWWYRSSREKE